MLKRSPLPRSNKPLKRTEIVRKSWLKRGTKPIAKVSRKRKLLNTLVSAFRKALIAAVAMCECCGIAYLNYYPIEDRQLCCHEIANGPTRGKALDKPFALLVVCWRCNSQVLTNKGEWPEARQLAALKRSRPQDFNLSAYNTLINPNAMGRITEEEVQAWV